MNPQSYILLPLGGGGIWFEKYLSPEPYFQKKYPPTSEPQWEFSENKNKNKKIGSLLLTPILALEFPSGMFFLQKNAILSNMKDTHNEFSP